MRPDGQPQNEIKFNYWPFNIVPNPGDGIRWADRKTLKEQITRLGRTLSRHDAVSLHLLWADFGAGKTHALLYLKQEAEKGKYGSILPLYSALPKGCRSFLDIYQAIVRGIFMQSLGDAYDKAIRSVTRRELMRKLGDISGDLSTCFSAISLLGENEKRIALAWLHAEKSVSGSQFKNLSLLGRIRTTDDAVLALTGIVRLFNAAGYRRVLFMVDEFQRLEVLRRQQQNDINAGLHGFFNSCDHGMSLLLSFSFGLEENIEHFLNEELLSRAHPLRIAIPKLQFDEAVEFLNDVIQQARDPLGEWPVARDVVSGIVQEVSKRFDLTPRRLLKAGGLVFESAGLDFEDGKITELDVSYLREMAERGDFDRIDEGEQR
jgi:P-loop Domain of unknown function (DUF2791)